MQHRDGYTVGRDVSIVLLDAISETASAGDGSRPVEPAIVGNALMYVHSRGTNDLRG